ncbi:MAG TPA: secretin N-terminal domain-containing protein [Thermoanaerobaculia bacterium]|nr:secretin N-terminal domain-containing protein [Thermoanaerobaculia bacterium]
MTTRQRPLPRAVYALSLLAALTGLAGCSGYRNLREAQVAESTGDWDRAVLEYLELIEADPANLRYKSGLLRAKMQASHAHFEQAKQFRAAGLLGQAMVELQKAVQLDPTNQYARAELDKVRDELEAAVQGRTPETIEDIKGRTRGMRAQPPTLNPRSPEPIDLEFPEPVEVKKIYQALGDAFGINVLFEPSLRDAPISIRLNQVTAQDALEIVMRTAGHFYKVLDEHSILVIPDTPQNRRKYEDLMIQTFFLSNWDVRDAMQMLRSLVESRRIAANESLNAIILRDTADKVKVAERIIKANDKAKAEVVVDVELLQLDTNRLQDLGISLNQYQVSSSLDLGGEDVPVRFSDLEFINASNWVLTVPSFLFDFLKNSSQAQTLAKPSLRITEGERARLTIGDRVPIPVTSFNSANTVGSNVIPITSFQYQDVGIRIELEPRVHHNEEISMQVMVEVSDLSGQIDNQPIIGTRTIETNIRLRDGETNFLAGLLRTNESDSEAGAPGFSDIPILGRLFSKKRTQNQRTDIVLTLTPHIIRRADITEEDLLPIWVGTESNITFRADSPRIESGIEGPFDEGDQDSSVEQLRQRLQRLPRGLRENGDEEMVEDEMGVEVDEGEQEPEPPPGVELIPPVRRNPLDRPPPERREPPEEEEPPPDAPEQIGALAPRAPLGPSRSPATSLFAQALQGSLVATGIPTAARQPPPSGRRVRRPEVPPATVRGGPVGTVTLSPQPTALTVSQNDSFELRILLSSEVPVSHLPIEVLFDSARLRFDNERSGALLESGAETETLSKVATAGRVILGASRLGQVPGVTGEGVVLRIFFTALQPGTAAIVLSDARPLGPDLVERNVVYSPALAVVTILGSAAGEDSVQPPPVRPAGGSPEGAER